MPKTKTCYSIKQKTHDRLHEIKDIGWAKSASDALDKIVENWYQEHEAAIEEYKKLKSLNPFNK